MMRYFDLEPSFSNFWSLFSINTSTRSGSRGFFYVTARNHLKFLDKFPETHGVWKHKWFYIEAPTDMPWNVPREWRFDKPSFSIDEEPSWDAHFIDDYLLDHNYDINKLLSEETLKLAGLNPAPI